MAAAVTAFIVLVVGAYAITQSIHTNVNGIHTGAGTPQDLANESSYNQVWNRDMTQIARDSQPLAPTATAPGVCNNGGTKQGCYDTDERIIADLTGMKTDVALLMVPPRYATANQLLQQALQLDIDGLRLRDQAIASSDPNASFGPSNDKLTQADATFRRAHIAFPSDNRPIPPYG